jgi:acetyl/propionyl-CoA carboxylase alpha subunit
VPVLPGTPGAVSDVAQAERAAREIGFPLLLKAAAGGGGIGMVRVNTPAELASGFAAATRRAQAAFGEGALYVERFLEGARHVEVQVFGDARGNIVHLHERECSIQRRHQKLVEESPAPNLPPATRRGLTTAAVKGASSIGYINAGTLEFLVDARGDFYFLEMNTRLQVEHPVTEEVTGLDLVVAQLLVAAGDALPWRQDEIVLGAAAIEARVYAEDPAKGFLPSPGVITRLRLPEGEGVRVESGVAEGTAVTVHYDPLLMKIVTAGATREAAVARMAVALDACEVSGVRTTLPFLRRLVGHDAFLRGAVHTQMVEQGAFNG